MQAAPPLQEQTWLGPDFAQRSPGLHSVAVQTQRPLDPQVAVPAPPSLHWSELVQRQRRSLPQEKCVVSPCCVQSLAQLPQLSFLG